MLGYIRHSTKFALDIQDPNLITANQVKERMLIKIKITMFSYEHFQITTEKHNHIVNHIISKGTKKYKSLIKKFHQGKINDDLVEQTKNADLN